MRKQIFVVLLILVLMLGGCSSASTVSQTGNSESMTEVKDKSGTLSSESKPTDFPMETEVPESEVTVSQPPKAESQTEGTKSTVASSVAGKENAPASEGAVTETKPAISEKPQKTPKPTEIPPQTVSETPEQTTPKSIYDYEFDIAAIKAECISIGQGMGLTLDSSLTPDNATWWNPVTASQTNQGTALKQNLESYIRFHTVENLGSYGLDEITDFNIYCEARGNGVYSVYFLFA